MQSTKSDNIFLYFLYKAKETAILLANEGDSVEKIAKVLQIKEEVVCKWLLER